MFSCNGNSNLGNEMEVVYSTTWDEQSGNTHTTQYTLAKNGLTEIFLNSASYLERSYGIINLYINNVPITITSRPIRSLTTLLYSFDGKTNDIIKIETYATPYRDYSYGNVIVRQPK